ncbi:MAG: hypothetical protein ACOH1H_12615 [Brevundimonas sp.]|jgi:hypothetical protein
MSDHPVTSKTRLTGEMMARGVEGLTLFGSGSTVLMVTTWWAMEPGDAGISLSGFAMLFLVICIPIVIVWALGGVVVALPLWAGLHALGMRNWPVPVLCGAGLVAMIWNLNTPSPVVAAAGALSGAVAGWGLWWMAYRRGGAV